MAKLDDFLQEIIADMDGVFGIAVVEMDARQLLGIAQGSTDFGPAYLEALAVAVVEMLRGKAVAAVESLLGKHLGTPIVNAVDDLCINAKNTRYFIAVIPEKPNLLVMLSTDSNTSVSLGWITVRRNMSQIAEHCL